MIKLFFVTDIHGSNVCYRKFLNALPIYGVDVAVLLGDLTGKVLVPMVAKSSSSWECTLMGQHVDIETEEELAKTKKTIENAGYYWVHQTPRGVRETRKDPAKIDTLFKRPCWLAYRSGWTWPTSASPASRSRCSCPGQRRLVRDRRDDRRGQARAPLRHARRGPRRPRDDHLLVEQPHAVADAARGAVRRNWRSSWRGSAAWSRTRRRPSTTSTCRRTATHWICAPS